MNVSSRNLDKRSAANNNLQRSSITLKTPNLYEPLSGFLKKKSRHERWQRRWFEANDHYLTYYKSPSSDKLLACIDLYQTGSIKLAIAENKSKNKNDTNDELDESLTEFSLELGDRFYIIKADTRQDAARWVAGLNARKYPKEPTPLPPLASSSEDKKNHEGRSTSFVAATPEKKSAAVAPPSASKMSSPENYTENTNKMPHGIELALIKNARDTGCGGCTVM